jgi:acetylornithine deacetylase/succinyl-diaminopimelate desuccinylase-like protein
MCFKVNTVIQVEKVYRYIDENLEHHISRLAEFVKQPAIGVTGEGTYECAKMIVLRMNELGFDTAELYNSDGNPIVYGEIHIGKTEAGRTLLLYGSYDSNPVEEENWKNPPFAATLVEHDRLGTTMIGRGVNNKMKVVGVLNAIEAVEQALQDLPMSLLVVFDGEEESFSPTLARFISDKQDWLEKADALYMPFSSQDSQGIARVQLGYKGIVYLEMESSGREWRRGPNEHEVHSMHRPVVDSPVWHLISALCSMAGKDGNGIRIECINEAIRKPTKQFQDVLQDLTENFDVDNYRKGLGVEELIPDPEDAYEVLNLLFTTSQINIDGIWGGYTGPGAEAIIPSSAHAKIELRLIPDQTSDNVFSCIRKHLDDHGYSDIALRKLATVESCQTSIDEEIGQALIKAYQDIGVDFQVWPSSLATIPIYLFNHPPLKLPFATGCVGLGGNSHGPNEYAVIKGKGRVAGLAEYEKCIASVLYEYLR